MFSEDWLISVEPRLFNTDLFLNKDTKMTSGRSKGMREKSEKVIRFKRIEGYGKKESIGKV